MPEITGRDSGVGLLIEFYIKSHSGDVGQPTGDRAHRLPSKTTPAAPIAELTNDTDSVGY